MEKPRKTKVFAVVHSAATTRIIQFFANEQVAGEAAGFGRIEQGSSKDRYTLHVDARYEFKRVLAYLEGLNSPPKKIVHCPLGTFLCCARTCSDG